MMLDVENVCTEIVANNLCIGCGVCAALCPAKTLDIRFNRFGEYNAVDVSGACNKECRLCLQVCPFSDGAKDCDDLAKSVFASIPNIKHTSPTGYYLGAFVGYSRINGHRENGASGGLATWLLEKLLQEDYVDYVACVSPVDGRHGMLFEYTLCKTLEEIRRCQKSCYYPVQAMDILNEILHREGRCAIVALPCFVRAIRLAMKRSELLRRRVQFLLGLVCGQGKSAFLSEYICAMAGGDPTGLKEIIFRTKDPEWLASDLEFRVCYSAGGGDQKSAKIHWTDGVDRIWMDRYFTPLCCDMCDDVFAELADVSFMDAWLPEYVHDWQGHSIVLTRDNRIDAILSKYIDTDEVDLTSIGIEETVRSQAGQILEKRVAIHERMKLLRESGVNSRYTPRGNKGNMLHRLETRLKYKVSRMSGRAWLDCGKDINEFEKAMQCVRWRVTLIRRFRKLTQSFARRLR